MGFNPRAFARGEWKYTDVACSGAVNTGAALYLLNGLQPGTGASQRIGMKITMRSIEFRNETISTLATGLDQTHRYIIFIDRQANGVAPAIGDLLTPATYLGFRNLANRKRFKIISDKHVVIDKATGSGGHRHWHQYIKLRRGIITDYNAGVAGNIADIATNALFLIVIGSNAAGATAGSNTGFIRTRYIDN